MGAFITYKQSKQLCIYITKEIKIKESRVGRPGVLCSSSLAQPHGPSSAFRSADRNMPALFDSHRNASRFSCAQGGNRTHTTLLSGDFKSPMSTNSITRAYIKLRAEIRPSTQTLVVTRVWSGHRLATHSAECVPAPSVRSRQKKLHFFLRPRAESNRRIRDLQSLALPLGD